MVLQTNFVARCPAWRFSCLYSRVNAWSLHTFPLPRQALQGLYGIVNPQSRILSRQQEQRDSGMTCCPCRCSVGIVWQSLSILLVR